MPLELARRIRLVEAAMREEALVGEAALEAAEGAATVAA
jgi:hypothetical protein